MALKLGEMLIKERLVTQEQLDEALKCHVIFGIKLGSSLIELGFVDENRLVELLSAKLAVPAVSHADLLEVPREVIGVLSPAVAEKYRVVPLELNGRRLRVAMADPSDFKAIDELAFITGLIIQPAIAPDVQIAFALEKYYRIKRDHRYLRASGELQKRRSNLLHNSPASVKPPPAGESFELLRFEIPEQFSDGLDAPERTELETVPAERYTIDKLSLDFARARTRDDVADTFIKYLGQEFSRAALLTIHGNSAVGWRAAVAGKRARDFHHVTLELTIHSELRKALLEPHFYLGPISDTGNNRPLLSALSLAPEAMVLGLPVFMLDRVAAMILVSAEPESLGQRLQEAQRLVQKASLAFQILVLKDKLLQT